MSAVPLNQAALELGVSVPTLRRWLRQGAPQARRGRRGNGGRALVDPAAVAAWRGSGNGSGEELAVLACELPELVADAVLEAFRECDGPGKRRVAGVLAATWYVVTVRLLDRLRRDVPEIADPATVPRQIDHLRSICSDFGRTGPD